MPLTPPTAGQVPPVLSDLLLPGNPFLGTLPRKYWRRLKKAFGYPTNFLPLAAGASGVVQPITIDSDSDFILMNGVLVMTDTTNLIEFSFPPALFNLSTSLNNSQVYQSDVHVKSVLSLGGGTPLYFGMPYIFPAGTVLNTRLSNLDTVNGRNYRIVYQGFKAFNVDSN